jgi:hypothetical protein
VLALPKKPLLLFLQSVAHATIMKYSLPRFLVSFGLLAATCDVRGQSFSDDFSNGLNPSYWSIIQTITNFYSVNAAQGDVHLATVATSNPGGLQTVFIRLNFAELGGAISNDFSAQISFSNASLPGPGLDQAELHTYYEDGSIFFDSFDNSSGINAHVWDGSAAKGLLSLSTNAGTFSISRTGTTVSGYFNGTLLYSEIRPAPLSTIEFALQNNNGSDDSNSVSFSNFSLTSSSVMLPPLRRGSFYPVSITNQANFTWAAPDTVPGEPTATRLPGAPVGRVTLDGVPFNIASNAAGKQAWHADIAVKGGTGEISITNEVEVYGVTNLFSLINTWDGHTNTYAWFVFTGSAGTVYTNYLYGGVDIRDYNGAYWENNINGTTTVNVFDCPVDNWGTPGRLDVQQIALPPDFATQTLATIQLVDNGGPSLQRVVLDGLTVQTASPPPLTINGNANLVTVFWPAALGGTIQTNGNLETSNWTNYGGPVSNLGGTNIITIVPSDSELFFRLGQ